MSTPAAGRRGGPADPTDPAGRADLIENTDRARATGTARVTGTARSTDPCEAAGEDAAAAGPGRSAAAGPAAGPAVGAQAASTDWAWHAAWTGNADWTGTTDWAAHAARGGWSERLSHTGRAVATSGAVAAASQAAALLLASVFWAFAAHRVPAPVLAVDTAAALCMWVVVRLARDAAAGVGAHHRLRAGWLAALGAALLASVSGWLIPGLAFLAMSPGFLVLLPLAAASAALWEGRPRVRPITGPTGPTGPHGRVGAEELGAAAVGLARLGTIIMLSDTGASQAHLALLAWLAPVALGAGPRCGWLLWQSSVTRRPRSPRSTGSTGSTGSPARALEAAGRAGWCHARRLLTGALAGGLAWPVVATALVLLLVGRRADAASSAFALAVFVLLVVGRLVEGRGPAVLPGVAVALVAAPLPWAAFSPDHVGTGAACTRLLLLILVIDAMVVAERDEAWTRPRAAAALAGLVTLIAALPAAASAYGVAGWALALLLGRFVAAVPTIARQAGRPTWASGATAAPIAERTRRVT